MRVSILIPAYNCERHIGRCLESAIGQSYPELEIVVVNDGSEDSTSEIIQTFAEADSRVIYIDQDNQGTYMSRKNALKIASGELVSILDADDFLEPDAIEKLVSCYERTSADIVVGNFCQHRHGGKRLIKNAIPINPDQLSNLRYLLLGKLQVYLWGRLYKRNILEQVNLPITRALSEDTLANIQIFATLNPSIAYLDETVINYVIHDSNISYSTNPVAVEKYFDEFKYLTEILEENNLISPLKTELAFYKCNMWIGYSRKNGKKLYQKSYRKEYFKENYFLAKPFLSPLMKVEMQAYNVSPLLGRAFFRFMNSIKAILRF
ncbi:Glycosyl transferase family 2 [Robiginitalea myxolifaciens]|uniref:Glycosyl transferase family 2 n=1 Tax=Robiginitalea myxolifaciens TaxID=400055 RepID=A0A1I6FN05_9FLAO|nr:glycosyltransferase family 2 protein [Robiginitalea myxolifaciens]SFR31332.1 Glycosyl transferase family 2 [Robiginitalea myxolifaciens]